MPDAPRVKTDPCRSGAPSGPYDGDVLAGETGETMTPAGAAATIAAIAAELRRKILTGAYQAGDRLPTRAELAAAHGVSLESAGVAHRRLRDEGLVALEQGRGAFVLPVGVYQVAVRIPDGGVTPLHRRGVRVRPGGGVLAAEAEQVQGGRVWRLTVVAADAAAAGVAGLRAVRDAAGGGDWRAASVEAVPGDVTG